MKEKMWEVYLAIGLCLTSFVAYFIRYLMIHDGRVVLGELISQIAFLPIYILLSTIMIDSLLSRRDKALRIKKLNMVIGAFFSECGSELLQSLSIFDIEREKTAIIVLEHNWDRKTEKMKRWFAEDEFKMNSLAGDLVQLKRTLLNKREFLLRMLENPNLLEHESFTELLWAVFHLTEELVGRVDLAQLNEADYLHFSGDIHRAYTLLILEWLTYMLHIKSDYPYLFSYSSRMNPFDPEAKAEIAG